MATRTQFLLSSFPHCRFGPYANFLAAASALPPAAGFTGESKFTSPLRSSPLLGSNAKNKTGLSWRLVESASQTLGRHFHTGFSLGLCIRMALPTVTSFGRFCAPWIRILSYQVFREMGPPNLFMISTYPIASTAWPFALLRSTRSPSIYIPAALPLGTHRSTTVRRLDNMWDEQGFFI